MTQLDQARVNTRVLTEVADDARGILLSADTVFPFTIFPDTITVDRMKASVTKRDFFRVSGVTSIQIEDILNVEADSGPFFGSIKIWPRFYEHLPLRVNFLWRDDAISFQRLLHGFIIARQKELDIRVIDKDELATQLLKLGHETV